MGTEPSSVGVQLFAWGVAAGACLAGGLAWVWASAVGYAKGCGDGYDAGWTLGRREGYDAGHGAGWIAGVNDAAVLDRLVTLDEGQGDPAGRLEAGLRRHRGAVAAWRAERRRGLRG